MEPCCSKRSDFGRSISKMEVLRELESVLRRNTSILCLSVYRICDKRSSVNVMFLPYVCLGGTLRGTVQNCGPNKLRCFFRDRCQQRETFENFYCAI